VFVDVLIGFRTTCIMIVYILSRECLNDFNGLPFGWV